MKIHATEMEWTQVPAIMPLLDSPMFMWVLLLVTLALVLFLASQFWKLHSLPKKLAKERAQGRFVFWLCIFGLWFKPLWVLAALLMVVDWEALRVWFVGDKV